MLIFLILLAQSLVFALTILYELLEDPAIMFWNTNEHPHILVSTLLMISH